MSFETELEIIGKLFLAVLLTSLLGMERRVAKKPGGTRTMALVGCSTTLFTSLAIQINVPTIISGVLIGIGFLGSGVINRKKDEIKGLTTGALIWTVATIGISIGLGYYLSAILITLISLFILRNKWINNFSSITKN